MEQNRKVQNILTNQVCFQNTEEINAKECINSKSSLDDQLNENDRRKSTDSNESIPPTYKLNLFGSEHDCSGSPDKLGNVSDSASCEISSPQPVVFFKEDQSSLNVSSPFVSLDNVKSMICEESNLLEGTGDEIFTDLEIRDKKDKSNIIGMSIENDKKTTNESINFLNTNSKKANMDCEYGNDEDILDEENSNDDIPNSTNSVKNLEIPTPETFNQPNDFAHDSLTNVNSKIVQIESNGVSKCSKSLSPKYIETEIRENIEREKVKQDEEGDSILVSEDEDSENNDSEARTEENFESSLPGGGESAKDSEENNSDEEEMEVDEFENENDTSQVVGRIGQTSITAISIAEIEDSSNQSSSDDEAYESPKPGNSTNSNKLENPTLNEEELLNILKTTLNSEQPPISTPLDQNTSQNPIFQMLLKKIIKKKGIGLLKTVGKQDQDEGSCDQEQQTFKFAQTFLKSFVSIIFK